MNEKIEQLFFEASKIKVEFDTNTLIIVRLWCQKIGDKFFVSNKEKKGYDELVFICNKFSFDSWYVINNICGEDIVKRNICYLILSLRDCNLLDLNGGVTRDNLNMLLKLSPCILYSLIHEIVKIYNFDDNSMFDLRKEFSKIYGASGSVAINNAYIRKYLTLTSFWDKFGLNYFDIKNLPYDDYVMFSHCMNIESEMKNNEMKKLQNKKR